MRRPRELTILDTAALRMREATFTAGVAMTYVVASAGLAYAAFTWGASNRATVTVLFGAAIALAALISQLPRERIVRSRMRELFFLGWSLLDLAMITAVTRADGGTASPLALLFFVPVVFAAMSYPPRSVAIVGAMTAFAYIALALTVGGASRSFEAMFAIVLLCQGAMSAWQARNHQRQRAALVAVSRADPLTGCLNRRGFEERALAEIEAAARRTSQGAVLLLDLDHFKPVNDRLGHAAGDELLCWVVQTLQRVVRPTDAIGRLGGDEFAVLFPEIVPAQALIAAERVTRALGERAPCTLGVATFPLDGSDLESILRKADLRLYAARRDRSLGAHGQRTRAHEQPQQAARRRAAGLAEPPPSAPPQPHRDPLAALNPLAPAGGPAVAFEVAGSPSERLSWAATLAEVVDLRMNPTHEHSRAVAGYAVAIAIRLGWRADTLGMLRIAAMLADLGKVTVPDRILNKPEPLSASEFDEMKAHIFAGAELVSRVEGLEPIVPWIRHSHESYDGSGYPYGLRESAIPRASRILLVADAFDALTSERPHRPALSLQDACEELERGAGSQFDPACVEALLAHIEAVSNQPVEDPAPVA